MEKAINYFVKSKSTRCETISSKLGTEITLQSGDYL